MRLLILVMLLALGCADNPPVTYPTIAPYDQTKQTLGPGDKLELSIFYGAKEQKALYVLDSSGELQVPYIGEINASGKSVGQVRDEIQTTLADGYLKDPIVSLTVVEINSQKCSVFGQVMHSGDVKFTPGMTIVEAIALSGGFSPLARKNLVRVTRQIATGKQTYDLPVEMIGEGKRPNFPMMPGDQVFVPERAW